MRKKICSLFLIMCLLFSCFSYVMAESDYSTTVTYSGTGTCEWLLTVPISMKPSDVGNVILEGTWNAATVFDVISDSAVIMGNDIDNDVKALDIFFDGINQVGNNYESIYVEKEISIEDLTGVIFGNWVGIFNYYLTVSTLNISNSIEHNGIVPENATYYSGVSSNMLGNYEGATAVFTEGDSFPDTVNDGDIYVYDGFEYRYNMEPNNSSVPIWTENIGQNGWAVKIIDKESQECGELLTTINNKNLVSLYCAFGNSEITNAPVIPETVTNMTLAFYNCNIKKAPIIPESVVNWEKMFWNCVSLEEVPYIHNKVVSLSSTFTGCTSLESIPIIPNSVVNMNSTFFGCSALKKVPTIPISVVNMDCTFYSCNKLTGVIEINANPENYYCCFSNIRSPIILTGSSLLLNELASTGGNNITVRK